MRRSSWLQLGVCRGAAARGEAPRGRLDVIDGGRRGVFTVRKALLLLIDLDVVVVVVVEGRERV